MLSLIGECDIVIHSFIFSNNYFIVTHALNKERPRTKELRPAPTLVVAPSHLINVWYEEAQKHTKPNYLNVGIYHGPRRR